jgi:RimJ/RimL family protein N-acetyltransferase
MHFSSLKFPLEFGQPSCLSTRLGIAEIVAITFPNNRRSRAVMEKIGMTRDPNGDFDHPELPVNHHLSRHVLYRIRGPALV